MHCIHIISLCNTNDMNCKVLVRSGPLVRQEHSSILVRLAVAISWHETAIKEHARCWGCRERGNASFKSSDRARPSKIAAFTARAEWIKIKCTQAAYHEGRQQSNRPNPGSRLPGKRHNMFFCSISGWFAAFWRFQRHPWASTHFIFNEDDTRYQL